MLFSTKLINSFMLKNESIPNDWPYWYKNVNMIGMAIKKEKRMPLKKRIVIGKMNLKIVIFFVWLDIAGLTNPKISLTIIGIEQVILNRIDTYICANNDWPGAVWINLTPWGSKLWLKKRINWLEILL